MVSKPSIVSLLIVAGFVATGSVDAQDKAKAVAPAASSAPAKRIVAKTAQRATAKQSTAGARSGRVCPTGTINSGGPGPVHCEPIKK